MKYIITISEPWDFIGPDGNNIIVGTIIRMVNDNCIIFESLHIQTFEQGSGFIYVLFPRIKEYNFSLINSNEKISLNGGLLMNEYNYEKVQEEELIKNSRFVFIGSLDKECK